MISGRWGPLFWIHCVISLGGVLNWSAQSPDLAPCNYIVWSYLKSLVFNDRPRTRAHLKNNIRQAVANIPFDMLERVERNFRVRLTQCIENMVMDVICLISSLKRCKHKIQILYLMLFKELNIYLGYFCLNWISK